MDKRVLILNLILLLIVATFGYQLATGWSRFEATHDVAAVEAAGEINDAIGTLESINREISPVDGPSIAALNPFSPDRNDIAVVISDGDVPAEIANATGAPAPVLIGTMLLGDERVALMGPRLEGAYMPVRVGELVEGWRLMEIDRKSVTVGANGGTQDVIMNDPTIELPRRTARTAEGAVANPVVVGQSPEPPPATSTAPPPTPASQAPATAPDPVPTGPRVIQTPFGRTTIPAQ